MIKFRVWDKENEIYLYDVQYAYNKMMGIVKSDDGEAVCYDEDCFGDFLNNKRYVVEQYTGLKDANGKEIYEGDIVHGYDQEPDRDDGYIGSSVIEVVNFKWGSFWLGDFKNQIKVYTPPIIEVIGNVHMNPELLEAANEARR
ncbi:YopX family protein [Levilactobacillus brevis]|uniref:YopX family protein n=1 Tax=Levilactobacillus brevis TaxID=1580 RepID=UPI00225DD990|nr:YopX family protein [Levilactobacillus brevis]MCX7511613.1 YopX family protein [Levilactobacillus brevis]